MRILSLPSSTDRCYAKATVIAEKEKQAFSLAARTIITYRDPGSHQTCRCDGRQLRNAGKKQKR